MLLNSKSSLNSFPKNRSALLDMEKDRFLQDEPDLEFTPTSKGCKNHQIRISKAVAVSYTFLVLFSLTFNIILGETVRRLQRNAYRNDVSEHGQSPSSN